MFHLKHRPLIHTKVCVQMRGLFVILLIKKKMMLITPVAILSVVTQLRLAVRFHDNIGLLSDVSRFR